MMTKTSSLIILLLAIFTVASAQKDSSINKDVIVVREYNPTIDDAFKINSTPTIEEVKSISETFDYNILTAPLSTEFKLKELDTPPLQKEQSLSSDKLSYIRAGIGNYTTLFGDAYYDAFNTKEHNLDFYVKQLSSMGKIKVDGDKEKAPYHSTQFQANYYKGYKTGRLNTRINYERLGYRNYGYQNFDENTSYQRTTAPMGYIPVTEKPDILSPKKSLSYSDFDFGMKYESMPQKRSHTDYSIGANYSSFTTKEDAKENQFQLGGFFITPADDAAFGVVGELSYYFPKEGSDTSLYQYNFTNEVLAELNPFLKLGGKTWDLHLGFKAYSLFEKDQDSKFYIAPDVKLDFDLIQDIFKAYITAGGSYSVNSYTAITKENPFITNDLSVKSSRHPITLSGGLKGYLTSRMLFNGGIEYGILKDQYFFTNEAYSDGIDTIFYSNRFGVTYDDGSYIKIFGELNYIGNKKYDFAIKGSYYKYDLDHLSHPFNMPELALSLTGNYHIRKDIHVSAEFAYTGERYALISDENVVKLDGIVDLNIMAEYDYTKNITFFGRLHNLAAQNYQRWYGYPAQSLNVLFGAMLKF